MYSVKNYRNYLPGLGLISTFILARIWDYSDYLTLNYGWAIFFIFSLNPIVFAVISMILTKKVKTKGDVHYLSTFG